MFNSENFRSRGEIASFLHTVADNLDQGTEITLRAGEKSVTMDPPAHVRRSR